MSNTTHMTPAANGTVDQTKTNTRIFLNDGTSVCLDFYEAILLQVDEVLPALECGVNYTAKMLCGETFWASIKGDCTLAGRCLADMVAQEKLPLTSTGVTAQNAQQYQLKELELCCQRHASFE
jgi:hypothetical protein